MVVFTLYICFDYYCVVDLFSLPFSPISADWRAQVHGVTVTSAAAWWRFCSVDLSLFGRFLHEFSSIPAWWSTL